MASGWGWDGGWTGVGEERAPITGFVKGRRSNRPRESARRHNTDHFASSNDPIYPNTFSP